MATKKIDIIQLKPSDKQVEPNELGSLATAGDHDEVGGRAAVQKYAQCPNCGFIGAYTERGCYSMAQCGNCGAVLTE